MPQFIGKTIGGYRIIEQIGVGGMATVFKAYQPAMERYVAFKVISTYLAQDPTFIKRFDQEAKVIARLEHAHILPVYDYGEVDGYLYLVMRFIEGGTLKDRLKDEPLTLTEARRVVNQIGSALEYTHQLNVVHRDLKPSNVLIDAQGDCYLTDFGIAKMVESSAGLTGSGIVGTPHYMSPEQGKTNKVDRRADIYAMGVVIYEMLTGQVPFDAETPVAVLLKHITEPLPLPRSIKPDLPEAVERVILKALAKEPADRYQSMRDLVIAFDEAVQTAPAKLRTLASPASPVLMMVVESGPAPASGWRRYFPWLLAVTGLVLVGLALAGGLALLWRSGSTGPNPQTEAALAVMTTPATPVAIQPTSGPTETQPVALEPAEVQPATSTPLIPTPTATFIPPTPTVLPTPTRAPTLSLAPVVSPTPTSTPSSTSPLPDTATPALPSPTPLPPLQLQVSPLALYEESAGNIIWLPDNKRLVIDGHKIVQYDGQTWQQAQELDREIARSTSLSPDGSMLAASFYESVKVWDTTGWGELVALDGSKNTEQVAFSPDGQLLATTTGGTVKLWEVASGNELRTLPAGSSAGPVAFSPDGRLLAAMGGVAGQEIKVWDTTSWSEVRSIKGHSNWIKSIVFSPDGKTLASGSVDSTVRLWDVATGRQLRAFMGHTNQVESVAFSPDGRLLASASWDLTVRLWDVASGKELNQLTGHSFWIRCVAFSPDGTMLASGSNGQMRLWQIKVGAEATTAPTPTLGPSAPLPTPVPLSESAISPDNIDQLTHLSTLESDQVGQLAWSPDGKLLAIGTYRFYIYDAQTLAQAYVTDRFNWFRSIDFSPDGSLLATASADGVRLWDTTGWGELRTLAGSKDTERVAFSPDGQLLATTTGGTVKLWEAASGNELRTLPAGSSAGPLAFSPDGRLLAAMGGVAGQEIKVWDTTSWSELHTLKGHSNWIKSIAFAPDGKTLASGSVDSTVRLWDVATGRQLRAFMGHTNQVESVAFSPDGRLLATSADIEIKLWDVTLGRELRTLSGHSGPVLSMAFSPDGAILATGGRDTAVRLWGLANKGKTQTDG